MLTYRRPGWALSWGGVSQSLVDGPREEYTHNRLAVELEFHAR